MLTREEYEKTLVRMFDNIRGEKYRGDKSCEGVNCADCPFNDEDCYMSNAFEAIEIVEKWGKEHPVTTMEDKFIEVFGRKPIDEKGCYCCPSNLGYKLACYPSCRECTNKFWKSEYVPPKKGE